MKIKLILTSLFVCSFFSFAQVSKNYKQLSKKVNANYFDLVSQANQEFSSLDQSILANRKAKKQFDRWAFYWKHKVNADGTFPNENAGYFNAGILNSEGKIVSASTHQRNAENSFSSENWVNIGPSQDDLDNNGYSNYPQMGRLNAFLRIKHPTDANQDILFVGAPNGGIWKSVDGGVNWSPKLDFVAGIGVTDIATVPGTNTTNYLSNPIYVSTGDYDGDNSKSIGVLKSTDGGETFVSTGLSYAIDQQKITGDLIVIDANTVFVGENQYIKKTVDGGTNWSNAYDSSFGNARFGRAVRNGNEIMFTSAFDVYYTSDYTNDANWGVVQASDSQNKSAVTTDSNGDFYIQELDGQIKKFDKTNSTFSNLGNIPPDYESQGGYNQAIIVTNDLLITGEFNGQSSTDDGTNWIRSLNGYWDDDSSPGTYIHSDHHRMGKLDGDLEFWSVNDGGLGYITYASSTDTKPVIAYKSSNVLVTQSYSVAINPSANDDAIVMANQDNDAFSKTNGTWYAVAMGDGIQSAINYNNTNIRYAGNQNGFVAQTDSGFHEQLEGNGNYVAVPGADFYFPLEIDKTNPDILYAGGDNVYKIDGSSDLTINTTNSGLSGTVTTIATHGSNVLAATDSNIRFSENQGSTWSTISTPSDASGNITSVDFDASNTNVIYVTYSGYNSGQKVYKTNNGGANWTNISGNLPNIITYEVMLKQNQPNEYLFLATELGVYYTIDSGSTWNKLGLGLPNATVRDMEIHYVEDKLVAATFGRGLWELNIQNNTLSANVIDNTIELSVYPNPAKDLLHIDIPKGNNYNYSIYNVVGGVVKSGEVTNKPLDISNLSKNMYLLRIYNENKSITKKIIKD